MHNVFRRRRLSNRSPSGTETLTFNPLTYDPFFSDDSVIPSRLPGGSGDSVGDGDSGDVDNFGPRTITGVPSILPGHRGDNFGPGTITGNIPSGLPGGSGNGVNGGVGNGDNGDDGVNGDNGNFGPETITGDGESITVLGKYTFSMLLYIVESGSTVAINPTVTITIPSFTTTSVPLTTISSSFSVRSSFSGSPLSPVSFSLLYVMFHSIWPIETGAASSSASITYGSSSDSTTSSIGDSAVNSTGAPSSSAHTSNLNSGTIIGGIAAILVALTAFILAGRFFIVCKVNVFQKCVSDSFF
jgi:hypothetical protein